ncbi:MAG: phosphatase PAP2 family protein [Candidatus Binatia bacterium]
MNRALSHDARAGRLREAPDLAPELEARAVARIPQVLPHEVVFGFFLALIWARLVAQAGPFNPSSLAFLGCLLAPIAVIHWARRRPTPLRWRVRLLLYAPLMGLSFFLLPSAFALLDLPSADARIVGWEHALLGEMNLAIQPWEHPLLTDAMMLAYLFFFYYLVAGPAYYCIHDLGRFRKCFAGLFTVYGLGFIGYMAFPTAGPFRFLDFAEPLRTGWITELAKPVVDAASNGVDAFPSIHVAVSVYLLTFDAWHHRRRFWRMLAPCLALWASTVYLRYHYGVDVLAGMVLAGIGLSVAAGYERFLSKTSRFFQPMSAEPAADRASVRESLFPDEA